MTEIEKFYNEFFVSMSYFINILMLIPLFVVLLAKDNLNNVLRFFAYYLLALFFYNLIHSLFTWSVFNYTQFWTPYLKQLNIRDTNFLFIIGRLIDYLFLGIFFSKIIVIRNAKTIQYISYILAIIAIIAYFFIDGYNQYGFFNPTINRLYVIVLPLIYIRYISRKKNSLNNLEKSYFLICIGLIIPELFGLLMSFFGNNLYETNFKAFVVVSIIRNCLMIISQIIFMYVFFNIKKRRVQN